MEAAIWGLPAIAISLDNPDNHIDQANYVPAARVARLVAGTVMRYGMQKETLLNVNVPCLPESEIRGIRLTRQGLRVYRDLLVRRQDPRGRPYYWIGGEAPTGVPEEGTDFGALEDGFVSITPLHLDLTAYRALEDLRSWEWDLFKEIKED
jgi:5'-nucleotidase